VYHTRTCSLFLHPLRDKRQQGTGEGQQERKKVDVCIGIIKCWAQEEAAVAIKFSSSLLLISRCVCVLGIYIYMCDRRAAFWPFFIFLVGCRFSKIYTSQKDRQGPMMIGNKS
jgi:hypothetical protein